MNMEKRCSTDEELEQLAQNIKSVIADVPRGADVSNQKFPADFEKWPKSRQDEWFEGTARATYMAQCYHLDRISDAIIESLRAAYKMGNSVSVGVLKEALKLCRCKGTGKYTKDCTLCGDSTFDHVCNDEEVECQNTQCKAARAVIAELR